MADQSELTAQHGAGTMELPKFPVPAALAGMTLEQKVEWMLATQAIQAKLVQAGLAAVSNVMKERDEAVGGAMGEMVDAMTEMLKRQTEVADTLRSMNTTIAGLKTRSIRAV